jgi:hypothetical protein
VTEKNKIAVCVVGDTKFLFKYLASFINSIRTTGKYSGDIIVITNYFFPSLFFKLLFVKNNKNIIFLKFPRVKFSKNADKIYKNLDTRGQPNRYVTKNFQWHKIHIFDMKLKNWDFIFYIDINMHIHYPINKVLSIYPEGKFTARTDGYPEYQHKLQSQFDEKHPKNFDLSKKYDLETKFYFQTGVMYFDTNLISKNTINEIIGLVEEYPITKTNEQGILNLYFMYEKGIFEELLLEIDDFLVYYYWIVKNKKIIITKQLREKYK